MRTGRKLQRHLQRGLRQQRHHTRRVRRRSWRERRVEARGLAARRPQQRCMGVQATRATRWGVLMTRRTKKGCRWASSAASDLRLRCSAFTAPPGAAARRLPGRRPPSPQAETPSSPNVLRTCRTRKLDPMAMPRQRRALVQRPPRRPQRPQGRSPDSRPRRLQPWRRRPAQVRSWRGRRLPPLKAAPGTSYSAWPHPSLGSNC